MDRDKAMELIGNDSSDIEIKFKFYKDLVEEYFPAGCSLKGEEKKTFFFKLDSQLIDAGFSLIEVEKEENRYNYRYRIAGVEAYVELIWQYADRFNQVWTDCHFLDLGIYLDQFSGNYDTRHGLHVHNFSDGTVAKIVSFIRSLPQWEAEWKKFDIVGIRNELDQRLASRKEQCIALKAPVRTLIKNIGLPYDYEKFDYGYEIYFRIAGRLYLKIAFSASECDESKLLELGKLVRNIDSTCRLLEGWDIKMRTEEENDEDSFYWDSYSWHEPEK